MRIESGWALMLRERERGRDLSPFQTSFDRLYVTPTGLGVHFQEDWWLLPEEIEGYPRIIQTGTGEENTMVVSATLTVFDSPFFDSLKDLTQEEFELRAPQVRIGDTAKGWDLRKSEGDVTCTTMDNQGGVSVITKIMPTATHQVISSYLSPEGDTLCHIIRGCYPAIGSPFQGQTGMETRVHRPFDGPQKWVGKIVPKS